MIRTGQTVDVRTPDGYVSHAEIVFVCKCDQAPWPTDFILQRNLEPSMVCNEQTCAACGMHHWAMLIAKDRNG